MKKYLIEVKIEDWFPIEFLILDIKEKFGSIETITWKEKDERLEPQASVPKSYKNSQPF